MPITAFGRDRGDAEAGRKSVLTIDNYRWEDRSRSGEGACESFPEFCHTHHKQSPERGAKTAKSKTKTVEYVLHLNWPESRRSHYEHSP